MWTGSWLAYAEILRNSAIGAVRFLHEAMRLHVVRIVTTGKDVTIEIMGQGQPYDRDYGPRPYYAPRPYDYDDE